MTDETIRCPFCDELIRKTAKKCKHCGEWLDTEREPTRKMEQPEDSVSHIRQVLGQRYEILEEIGRGGMACVYRAVQKSLQRTVALKIVHQNLIHDTEFIARFHREARTAASLNHPNIVQIFDEGQEGTVHYIVMEYLEGTDLHKIIQEKGPLSTDGCIQYIAPIADALQHAHDKGVIHRDVKSSNIIVTKEGRPVLTDFGIAHAASGTKLTRTGTIIGTPEYMSPEQASGRDTDHRSDLYSLGVVLYECLAGKVPFKGDNPLTTIHKIIHEPPEPVSKQKPDVPEWLDELVLRALAKTKDDRPESCGILSEMLLKGSKGEGRTKSKKPGYPDDSDQRMSKVKTASTTSGPGVTRKWYRSVLLPIAIGILAEFLVTGFIVRLRNPIEIEEGKLRRFIDEGHVQTIVFVNNTYAEIHIKKAYLDEPQHSKVLARGPGKYAKIGPHYRYNFSSYEQFLQELEGWISEAGVPSWGISYMHIHSDQKISWIVVLLYIFLIGVLVIVWRLIFPRRGSRKIRNNVIGHYNEHNGELGKKKRNPRITREVTILFIVLAAIALAIAIVMTGKFIKHKTYRNSGSREEGIPSNTEDIMEEKAEWVDVVAETNEPVEEIKRDREYETYYGESGHFTDHRDGQTYKWVRIGDQVWMAENLNYETYSGSWAYDNNEANAEIYGRLYDGKTAGDVCPDGWHLPSDAEWVTLIEFLGGSQDAGGKMKEPGTVHWNSPNAGATNESGFTALPDFDRDCDGSYSFTGRFGGWWCGELELWVETLWGVGVDYKSTRIAYLDAGDVPCGPYLSVRCIRD